MNEAKAENDELSSGDSIKYMWNSKPLSSGSYGSVFKGRNKETGELVAVKCFHKLNIRFDERVKKELLQAISHENIVAVLDFEQQIGSNHEVLIMEYCNGKDLKSAIEKPKNAKGLKTYKYIKLLHDITKAAEYLRREKLIHRDIKPGNIMKHTNRDKKITYKLGDLGTMRLLPEDKTSSTFAGSPDYMDPIYFRLDFDGTRVDASVDLWSLGATFYHLATGRLPFKFPSNYQSRLKHERLTSKEVGVISIIVSDDGATAVSSTLPEECELNYFVKYLLTPLLAGLMETRKDHKWSLQKYFEYTAKILSDIERIPELSNEIVSDSSSDSDSSDFGFVYLSEDERNRFHVDGYVSRKQWGARSPKQPFTVIPPVSHVFIHHTAGVYNTTFEGCKRTLRGIQREHQSYTDWIDVAYQWLIGGDGRVYEGRNWDKEGAHTYGFNRDSISICFLGNFNIIDPPPEILNLAQNWIAYGVSLGHIREDYKLHGHCDAGTNTTDGPGHKLYKIIQSWPRYEKGPLKKPTAMANTV